MVKRYFQLKDHSTSSNGLFLLTWSKYFSGQSPFEFLHGKRETQKTVPFSLWEFMFWGFCSWNVKFRLFSTINHLYIAFVLTYTGLTIRTFFFETLRSNLGLSPLLPSHSLPHTPSPFDLLALLTALRLQNMAGYWGHWINFAVWGGCIGRTEILMNGPPVVAFEAPCRPARVTVWSLGPGWRCENWSEVCLCGCVHTHSQTPAERGWTCGALRFVNPAAWDTLLQMLRRFTFTVTNVRLSLSKMSW